MGTETYWVYAFEWEVEDDEVRHVYDIKTETVEALRTLSDELEEPVSLTQLRLSHGVGRDEQTFESICGHGPNVVTSMFVNSPDELVAVDDWLDARGRGRGDSGEMPGDLCGHCWENLSR